MVRVQHRPWLYKRVFNLLPPSWARLRFGAVAEEWLENKNGRLREWTRRGYRASLDNEILPRFGHRKLRDITVDEIAKFVRVLEARDLSTSTIENHLKPLSGTFRYALRRGYVSVNPVALLTSDDRPAKREKTKAYEWTTEEIALVFKTSEQLAKQPNAHADYTAFLKTAAYTGLRLGELLGLQWQDVDLAGRVLHVQRQFTKLSTHSVPKTAKGIRRVPLSPGMVTLLKAEKERAFAKGLAGPEDPVFPARTGGPQSCTAPSREHGTTFGILRGCRRNSRSTTFAMPSPRSQLMPVLILGRSVKSWATVTNRSPSGTPISSTASRRRTDSATRWEPGNYRLSSQASTSRIDM